MNERNRSASLNAEKELLKLKLRLAQLNGIPQDDQSFRSVSSGLQSPKTTRICPRKFMAPFDESRDDLDAYLHRFERFARGQGWERREWATALSLCLGGEALSVFGRMPADDSMNYDKVKKTLLQRFRLTAEGFRKRFRGCKPENAEPAKKFASRLSNYFDRCMEMANVEKTYEVVRDHMVLEQFLNCCSNKLGVLLKERKVASLDDVTEHADQYLEAQGLRNLGKTNEDVDRAKTHDAKGRPQGVPNMSKQPIRCFLCNRIGHQAMNCRAGDGHSHAQVVCQLCNRRGHCANECRSGTTDIVACIVDSQGSNTKEAETTDKVACIVDSQRNSAERGQPAQKEGSGKNEIKLYSQGDCLPVVDEEVHGQRVKVLRDMGTNMVLVKRSLVD
uniref:CCHC-type domain-containing protein n=1 Tax=Rhipicephalus pulchellus TaxID=72859 RepID=L7M5Y6_RHIPC